MAAIVRDIYTGEEQPEGQVEDQFGFVWPIILPNVTHLSVHDSITSIPSLLFYHHKNLVELICHNGVGKVEAHAFWYCPRLKRLVMPSVEEVGEAAFFNCEAMEHVECAKLEIIRERAFHACTSIKSINLSSAKIVENGAFHNCTSLMDVKFGKNLESIGQKAFRNTALKRITIPLRSGLFTHDDVFVGCKNLHEVCLIEEEIVHETAEVLFFDKWKNGMKELIDSINGIVQNADAGCTWENSESQVERRGEKTMVIREWISSVLSKIVHYKAQHRCLVNEAATVISDIVPNDILTNNILPFISLPLHTFHGEDFHTYIEHTRNDLCQ